MNSYAYAITNVDTNADTVLKTVQVGSHKIAFTFQWAIVSDEQMSIIQRYLDNKAHSDPIKRVDGNYDRTYDWFTYYYSLKDTDLTEWLSTDPELANSVVRQPTTEEKIRLLTNYIEEAKALYPALLLYSETLAWQAKVVIDNSEQTCCLVRPGGWNRNQDNILAFRFVSPLEHIGQGDLANVTIEFEVYDE